MEKDQLHRENRKNLTREEVVRKILSPKTVAIVPNLCNIRGGQETWVKGSVAPVLASECASSLPGSPA